jgi:hypothetical protein
LLTADLAQPWPTDLARHGILCITDPVWESSSALPSAPAPPDSVRTRHMARMDSFNYPDAVTSSDGDADGTVTVAISKTTEALHDNAMEDVSDSRTLSGTSRKVGKIEKKNGTPTKVFSGCCAPK